MLWIPYWSESKPYSPGIKNRRLGTPSLPIQNQTTIPDPPSKPALRVFARSATSSPDSLQLELGGGVCFLCPAGKAALAASNFPARPFTGPGISSGMVFPHRCPEPPCLRFSGIKMLCNCRFSRILGKKSRTLPGGTLYCESLLRCSPAMYRKHRS